MDYNFKQDIKAIREMLELSQEDFAEEIGVDQKTISRNELGENVPSAKLMERVYSYAFDKNIKINKLKEMLWLDHMPKGHRLLFHGAKSSIEGALSAGIGRTNNDFGQGFYAEHPIIQKLIAQSRDCDYIIASIVDNRMFQIINHFIDGEITDEQCIYCLVATHLDMQYVFVSEQSLQQVKLVERCYISYNEREYFKKVRTNDAKLGNDKVKLARIQYRGQGKYIDEILI